ncbi:hypothetical protein Fmac_013977 [Flemingia macrophylla]|uniref:Large ribosomal subunit protein uL23m n=1 Tax=Flemingia macrophylla TaxID=520843 RepID=A0ABD1MAG3_9FABA
MGSRVGRRVVQFANLPIKLLMPSSFTNIQEIALKTIPSATKIEIKRVLESLYGFEVDRVRTLNMDGKKKKRGGLLIAKPDYKKAYVTLKTPLSISTDLYPIRIIQDDQTRMAKQAKSSVVQEEAPGPGPYSLARPQEGGPTTLRDPQHPSASNLESNFTFHNLLPTLAHSSTKPDR